MLKFMRSLACARMCLAHIVSQRIKETPQGVYLICLFGSDFKCNLRASSDRYFSPVSVITKVPSWSWGPFISDVLCRYSDSHEAPVLSIVQFVVNASSEVGVAQVLPPVT